MTIVAVCLSLFAAAHAHAAVRVAPGRGVSVVPRTGVVGAVGMPGAGAAPLKGLSAFGSQISLSGVLPTVDLPTLRNAVLPSVVQPAVSYSVKPAVVNKLMEERGMRRAVSLNAEVEKIGTGQGQENRAVKTLRRMFDFSATKRPGTVEPVKGAVGHTRRGSLGVFKHSDRRGKFEPSRYDAPAAQTSPSYWKKIWSAVKTVAALGFGLYGGIQIGDLAYSFALAKIGLLGLGAAALLTAGAAYWLRRRTLAGKRSLLYTTLLGAFTFSALGQLLWDATTLASVGLGAGALLGVLAALYAAGFFRQRV